jgi:hypothetical protein
MKRIFFAAALCAGAAFTHPALAERWVAPVNGNVSAVMMQDGDVMMKVQIPEKEFQALGRDMKSDAGSCRIKDIYPGETDTMILVCSSGK